MQLQSFFRILPEKNTSSKKINESKKAENTCSCLREPHKQWNPQKNVVPQVRQLVAWDTPAAHNLVPDVRQEPGKREVHRRGPAVVWDLQVTEGQWQGIANKQYDGRTPEIKKNALAIWITSICEKKLSFQTECGNYVVQ